MAENRKRSAMRSEPNRITHHPILTLTQCLELYPQFFSSSKIAVVQKGVGKITKLSKKYAQIDTLYLSNNNLESLENIDQFANLVHLTLANNNLKSLEETIHTLEDLLHLRNLTIHGNPLCKSPFYRETILNNLKHLSVLDGKSVTEQDVSHASILLRKIDGIMDILIGNYIELIKFDNFNKRLGIKTELAQKVSRIYSFASNYKVHVPNPHLSQKELRAIRRSLWEDVQTLSLSVRMQQPQLGEEKLFEAASSLLIMRQKDLGAEMQQKIDQQIAFQSQLQLQQTSRFQTVEEPRPQLLISKHGRGRTSSKKILKKTHVQPKSVQPVKRLQFNLDNQEQQLHKTENRHLYNSCLLASEKKRPQDDSPSREQAPQPQRLNFEPQVKQQTQVPPKQDVQLQYINELIETIDAQTAYITELERLNQQQQSQLLEKSKTNHNEMNELKQKIIDQDDIIKNQGEKIDECLQIIRESQQIYEDKLDESNQYCNQLKHKLEDQNKEFEDERRYYDIRLQELQKLNSTLTEQNQKEKTVAEHDSEKLLKALEEQKLLLSQRLQETIVKRDYQEVYDRKFQELDKQNLILTQLLHERERQLETVRRDTKESYELKFLELEKQNAHLTELIYERDRAIEMSQRNIKEQQSQIRQYDNELTHLLKIDLKKSQRSYHTTQKYFGSRHFDDQQTSFSQLISSDREHYHNEYSPTSVSISRKSGTRHTSAKRLQDEKEKLHHKFQNLQSQISELLSSNTTGYNSNMGDGSFEGTKKYSRY